MPQLYFQQLRRHGDILKRTVGGYLVVQGRADDTMNLGGIKVLHYHSTTINLVVDSTFAPFNIPVVSIKTSAKCASLCAYMLLISLSTQIYSG